MNIEKNKIKLKEISNTIIELIGASPDITGKVSVFINVYQGGLTGYKTRIEEDKKFNYQMNPNEG